MPLVLSYARVSTGRQKREGAGIQRQIEAAAAYAKQHDLTLDESFSLADEGRSASKGHHLKEGAALQRILQAVTGRQLGPSPTLVVEDISRLSRLEPLDGLEQVFLPLIRHGARIVLLEDGTTLDADTLNRDQTALVVLVLKIQAAAAYAQKLRSYGLSHRERNRQQILDGQPVCKGWAPSWIEYNDGWQLNSYAPTIQRLLELIWTSGAQVTAQTLNREGHRAPAGGPWSQTSVMRLLENCALYGARRIAVADHASKVAAWRKKRAAWEATDKTTAAPKKPKRSYSEVPDTYPALMSKADHARLMAVIAKRATSPKERGRRDQMRYIAQLLTTCVCGAPIGVRSVSSRHGHGQKFTYLQCRSKQVTGTSCGRKPIRVEPVHAHLLTRLRYEHLAALVEGDAAAKDSQGKALLAQQAMLQATLAEQEQQLVNAKAALKERAKSGRSVEVYEEALDEAAAAVAATETQLATVLADLTGLSSDGLSEQLETAVQALLREFAKGESTVETRQAVNSLLHRLGAKVTIDTEAMRCGLRVGDGEAVWERLNPDLDMAALSAGMVASESLEFEADEVTSELLRRFDRGDGVLDLSEPMRKQFGGDPIVLMSELG